MADKCNSKRIQIGNCRISYWELNPDAGGTSQTWDQVSDVPIYADTIILFSPSTNEVYLQTDKGNNNVSAKFSFFPGITDIVDETGADLSGTITNYDVFQSYLRDAQNTCGCCGGGGGGGGGVTTFAALTDTDNGPFATGDVLYYDGAVWQNLPVGANGEVLTLAAGVPSWAASGAGVSTFSALTDTQVGPYTAGDVLYYDGAVWQTLAVGADGEVLKLAGGIPSWDTDLDTNTDTFSALTDTQAGPYVTGDVLYYDGAVWQTLPVGTNGDVLKLAAGIPSWDADVDTDTFSALTDTQVGPYTTGDVLYYDGAVWQTLAVGTDGQLLGLTGGIPAWENKSNVWADTTDTMTLALDGKYKAQLNHTLNLPAITALNDGREIRLVPDNGDWTAINVTFSPDGAQTIANGQAGVFAGANEIVLIADFAATNWFVAT